MIFEGESKSNRWVSARVIGFGFAALAIFVSFWTVHWLRPTTEPPRTTTSSQSMLISTELAEFGSPREGHEVSGGIADRWFPLVRAVAPPTPAPALNPPEPALVAQPSLSLSPAAAKPVGDAAEASESLFGQVPLPRRRPVVVERNDPPLPRPRPGGSVPQSAFIAVGANDDRYPSP